MEQLIKNLDRAQPLPLKEQVAYEKGKVVSLTLTQRPGVGMTLFAFDAGEGISTHAAPGDAMVYEDSWRLSDGSCIQRRKRRPYLCPIEG